MKRILSVFLVLLTIISLVGCRNIQENSTNNDEKVVDDELVFIKGGTFLMGSPEDEVWRGNDELQHEVTVNDFYISPYEVTQQEYEEIIQENPSHFSGDRLPVENVTWLDAIRYANAKSEKEGLQPVYQIEGEQVTWDRSLDGYRLPTEAEWEYACRGNTTTPFNTETSISDEEANYYGYYPYQIEENYFSQDELDTKPGIYRETTIEVGHFKPNAFGLYDMHGNVSEWVWDYYGEYPSTTSSNPTGADEGELKIYRGGGWNDFAKNLRSSYRATLPSNQKSISVGIRLVRNATAIDGNITDKNEMTTTTETNGKILIAYFSWGGNTEGIARQIQEKTGADLFEITLVHPYSDDYNTVLDQAQEDQNQQARPELKDHVSNMDEYDTVILGYPNWWASIPMPIASFLEEYDFSNKTIIPFCSHGGGRFGQSLTAISKLVPNANMGDALSVHYSGDSYLDDEINEWLEENQLR